jgi:endonuclease/exonuclease/phosphatase family metal-dependent hydrolase
MFYDKLFIEVILMKKILIAFICVVIIAVVAIPYIFGGDVVIKPTDARLKDNENIIVASYNTAAPWGNLIKGTGSDKRAKLFAQQINDQMPDVLGVQEINSDWVAKMEEFLPQYGYYGVKRGGDDGEKYSEMNGIFYLKEKFELLESNTFWLSDTPDVESKHTDAACYRICSYVILKNKTTGKVFAHFNTHFDHVSESAQELGGNLVSQRAKDVISSYGEIPIVITGDLNQYSDAPGCVALEKNGYFNANKTVDNGDNMLTYNGWTNDTEGRPIDYIFVNNSFSASEYRVITETGSKTNVSDHYMIMATLK